MQQFMRDEFLPELSFQLEETNDVVDGKHVLARVAGQFFVPDGESRNKRFYPKSLWERVLSAPDVKQKLEEKRMFGTISHEQEISDAAVLDGKISHIITKLWIDQSGRGMGEALIVNTPAGQILNTLLRAGSKLFVSSRAYGRYVGTHSGVPKVDENTYDFRTFDFVMDPGFLEANPQVAEGFFKNEGEGDTNMLNEKMVEKILDENATLKVDLNSALSDLDKTKADASMAVEENKHLKEQLKVLEQYQTLGNPEAVTKEVKDLREENVKVKKAIAGYTKLGEAKDINKVFENFKRVAIRLRGLTEEKNVFKAVNVLDKAVTKSLETLKKYKSLGEIKEIEEVFSRYEKLIEEMDGAQKQEAIAKLAAELGVSEEAVAKVYDSMSEDEIREFFKQVRGESKTHNKYNTKPENKVNEKSNPRTDASSGARLMEKFCR